MADGAPLSKSNNSRTPVSELLYRRLAFCRVAQLRWRAAGNTVWARNYEQEAASVRRRLDRLKRPAARRPADDGLRRQIAGWLEAEREEEACDF